ncbi:hypothetical protein PLICRDRAFT_180596 [Plicaturopsis crispa FD-325 SS-3]|uniref:PABC domain-containing protein n=1 Tax=Plicaturopsis crispa FD-325 SS-3 TaxID=944288 RepID=A0A0C9T4Z2_PLICR|nr:hypothetical protein PLICRDRAFT_180596 [Plicaturopsis crispa FD-325 SS-3]
MERLSKYQGRQPLQNKMIGSKSLYVSLAQRREVRRQLESEISQCYQIRMQQAAAAGLPGGYINTSTGPCTTRPDQAATLLRLHMAPPFGQGPPQGYGIPGYPAGAPRPPDVLPPAGPCAPGAACCGSRFPAPARLQAQPQTHNAGAPPAGQAPPPPPALPPSPVTLTNASPMEQKQMLGEVIYMKIAPSQPELAGKITGMLLGMDNTELLHLLDAPDAMATREALAVLHEFAHCYGACRDFVVDHP